MTRPTIIASDLEGIFLPEIWIAVAEKMQIHELHLTTRDIADYDELMRYRMDILDRHALTLTDIQAVIATMEPLAGAVDFLNWLRARTQIVVVTDSFYEFVAPFLPKLGYPTLFAHTLEVDGRNALAGYRLRTVDGKRKTAAAFRELGFYTIAIGDSYNDVQMLAVADQGILFRPPANVVAEFPQFPVVRDYAELRELLEQLLATSRT